MDKKRKYVRFTIDAELLRELGERLVGKPYIALGELVKNAYDADATKCIIRFTKGSIEVADNGNGMASADFVGKWMRIGSTHKRTEKVSSRFKRNLTGSKGVGRLSAQFLGSSIKVVSRPIEKPAAAITASVDWNEAYKKGSLVQAGAWINYGPIGAELPHGFVHGTSIAIGGLKDSWTPLLFKKLAAELWFLQPPPAIANSVTASEKFQIELLGVGNSELALFEHQTNAALENWIAKLEGSVSGGRDRGIANLNLTFHGGESVTAKYKLPNKALESASFEVRIFRLSGRQSADISVDTAREYFKHYGGVHIYDSGFRLPFYGGEEQDWLNIEMDHSHRLTVSRLLPEALRSKESSLNDLPTLGRVFGVVGVSTALEASVAPKGTPASKLLTVQITRDRLIDNDAFEDLRHFVRWAFDFYSYESTKRKAKKAVAGVISASKNLEISFDEVRQRAEELKSKVPPKLVAPLELALSEFESAEELRKQEADAERVLLGALATAGMGSIALQHELSKELVTLESLIKSIEAELDDDDASELALAIRGLRSWVKTASQTRRLFSPLFDAEDRDRLQRMRARRVIERLGSNLRPLLRGTPIEVDEVPETIKLPRGTLAGWNAVFQNIFVNSVNAMLESKVRRIRCRTVIDAKRATHLIIEDTGVGTDLKTSDELFRPFTRKLDLPEEVKGLGLGGMGIGLTIVRMVCRTFGCTVKFVAPVAPFKTALEIVWEEQASDR